MPRWPLWLLQLLGRAPAAKKDFPEPVGSEALIITFFETPCLVLYAYLVGALSLWLYWALRRSISHWLLRKKTMPRAQGGPHVALEEPLLRRRPEKPDPLQAWQQSLTDEQGRVVTFEGYVDDRLGGLASCLVPMTSFVILAVFGLVLYDYYSGCEWSWPEQLCYIGTFPITGSFDANSHVFLVLWFAATIWFGLLIWGAGGQMANLFRLHASLSDAKYLHVTVQERKEVLSSGFSRCLDAWGGLLRLLKNLLGFSKNLPGGVFALSGGSSQTVLKCFDKSVGLHFVEFRCVRYVLDPKAGGFVRYDPSEALSGGHAGFLRILDEGGLRSSGPGPGGPPDAIGVDEMLRRAGHNKIPFEVDGMGMALTEEFATFFFLYQFAIYAVCLWYSYWHYTIIALSVAGVAGFFNVIVRIGNQSAIKRMMEQPQRVTLKRDGHEVEVNAEDIVPGDIVKVGEDGWLVPCDLLLLKGAAVCDESTLTGESMPVQRLAPTEILPEAAPSQRPPAKHVLVAGTTVLQASGGECWAVATHTGVNTQKGQLLLMILYPPKLLFKYDEQLAVVFSLLIAYAMVVMVVTMRMMYVRYATEQALPLTATWASAIFTCSCVLPTMLHIVLSVGQVVAAKRLKGNDYNIFCAAPKRIALGGKVRAVCFDKTGTLTENSLQFFGVHCIRSSSEERKLSGQGGEGPFQSRVTALASSVFESDSQVVFEDEPRSADWNLDVLCGLASAHSLSPFSGNEAGVVGNAVEVNMFQATGWRLDPQDPGRVLGPALAGEAPGAAQGAAQGLRILRRFDFSHSTMTMSSVVEHTPSGQRGVFCKGSFEQVKDRCIVGSIPADFVKVAQAHAFSGMYVLALAARMLPASSGSVQVAEMMREDAEQSLVMLGLLLFKNPLRCDTRATIESLRGGEVRSVMITGDAAGTAIRIAKEAAMVEVGTPVLLGDIEPASENNEGGICWLCQDEDMSVMSELLLSNDWLTWRRNYKQWREGGGQGARGEAADNAGRRPEPPQLERRATWPDLREVPPEEGGLEGGCSFSTEELVLSRLFEWCELAVTQRAYEWLQDTPCSPDLRRVLLGSRQASLKKGKALSSGKGDSSLAWELLTSIRIFARMTPSGKVSVVEGLMSQGLICAMVGDGGNDSGALRTAHVGLALSNATSATVVAPFTTNRPSVAPVIDLLREGRAALATSFAGYKYAVHYGLLNSFFKFQVFWYGVGQAMSARYLQDMLGFLSFSWAISQAMPARELVGDRPTSSLFSVYTVSSVLGMWILNMLFMQAGLFMITSHEDYEPFPVHLVRVTEWWKLSRNWETTTLFFIYTFQLFWSAVVFSFGHLFRLPWYQNLVLLFLSATGFGFLVVLLLSEPSLLTRCFHLAYEPIDDLEPWSPELPSPAMSRELRARLLRLVLANLLACGLFERLIVQGHVGRVLRDKCRSLSKHITLRL